MYVSASIRSPNHHSHQGRDPLRSMCTLKTVLTPRGPRALAEGPQCLAGHTALITDSNLSTEQKDSANFNCGDLPGIRVSPAPKMNRVIHCIFQFGEETPVCRTLPRTCQLKHLELLLENINIAYFFGYNSPCPQNMIYLIRFPCVVIRGPALHTLLNNLRPHYRLIFLSPFQVYALTFKKPTHDRSKMHLYSFSRDATINSLSLKKNH